MLAWHPLACGVAASWHGVNAAVIVTNHGLAVPPPPAPRMDPLWNSLVVGGFYAGKPFLGTSGMIGTNYTDAHVATGG